MEIWVLAGSYENESFVSTHIQRKGAMIAGILDVYDFLGIEGCDDYAERFPDCDNWYFESDKLRAMDDRNLNLVFGALINLDPVYDNSQGYRLEILKSRLSA